MSQANRIANVDFNFNDLNAWMDGKSHEEIGRVIMAIGIATQANDEAYLEQWSFIDRIVYQDGTWRKLIRGSGKMDEITGIDRPIVKDESNGGDDEEKTKKERGSRSKKSSV